MTSGKIWVLEARVGSAEPYNTVRNLYCPGSGQHNARSDRCASATKSGPCWPASSANRDAGPSRIRSRSASSSTQPISCRSRRPTSWPTPSCSARPASAFSKASPAPPTDERRVRVPTLTDPRGLDVQVYKRLGQSEAMRDLEARAIAALRAFGVLMTDTCINYQTIMPPVRGEHLAMGDTGVVIYSNSVFGARSNFEGGPSALAAGLTGRTPRYGFHLDECRLPTRYFRLGATPRDLSEWGALGGIVGRECGSYWEVPLIEGIAEPPGSDALKHFGAALASYGSVALFHMPGITADDVSDRRRPAACRRTRRDHPRRDRGFRPILRRHRRQGRCRRVRRAATVAHRNGGSRRRAVGTPGPSRRRRCWSRPRPRSSTPPTAWG